jgi:hypothetical protein
MEEILKSRAKLEDLPTDVQTNLNTLLERINKLRTAYGKPLKVNDGYRRAQDKPKNGATQSNHYVGAAIDLDDNDSADLWYWTFNNLQLMQEIGLWMEDPRWTHGSVGTWMHYQIFPPKSDHRIYIPSSNPAAAPTLWDGKYDSKYDKA